MDVSFCAIGTVRKRKKKRKRKEKNEKELKRSEKEF